MSLDISLTIEVTEPRVVEVFEANLTHNLNTMAKEVGLYYFIWRPEEVGIHFAYEIVAPLEVGLAMLKAAPERFKKFDHETGYGTYEQFIHFLEQYIDACKTNPKATIGAYR